MSNPTPSGEEFLTTAQVRDLTGWSVTSINRWAQAGDLPVAQKLPGHTGAYLFRREDIDAEVQRRAGAAA